MFKKKFVLPPRPQLPSKQEMVEDLMIMNDNDCVLTVNHSTNTNQLEAHEAAYQKLKAFLELNHDLSETSSELKTQCAAASADVKSLKTSGGNLKSRADDVLRQF